MFGIGLPEMLVILAVALIVVGPDKLPGLARSLARSVIELKKTAESVKEGLMAENPLPDIKNDLKTSLPNLADLKPDLSGLPDLHGAAKRLQEEILDPQGQETPAPPRTQPEETVGPEAAPANIMAIVGAFQPDEPDGSANAELSEANRSLPWAPWPFGEPSAQANAPAGAQTGTDQDVRSDRQ